MLRISTWERRKAPISVSGERADIRISDGVSGKEEGEWISFQDYDPVRMDGTTSFFTIPYDSGKQHMYRVSLYRPGTDELLFETVTAFGLIPEEE